MLNRAERLKILKLIRVCCTIGHLPVAIGLPNWQLLQHSSTGRIRWPNLTYFGVYVLHSLYKVVTLFGAYFTQEETPLYQLIIHALYAISAPLIPFWYYQLYINHAGALSVYFRMTLTGKIGGTIADDETTETNFVRRLKAYTIQEFLSINLPYAVAPLALVVIGTCTCYPSLQFLLYAGLPEQFQTCLSFTILMMEELRYILVMFAVTVPVLTLQLMSFDLVNNQLKTLIFSIERTHNRKKLERTYGSLRQIQLYVTITNVVNRYLIFSWKVMTFCMCIGAGYAAIAHFGDYPVFGVMYYVFVIEGTLIYTVSYDQAFRIPRLFKEVAQLAVFRLGQVGYGDMWILKKQMRSIPQVGIKVGEFHMLDRESTPSFVDFVLTNIVSMLVAYK